MLNIVPGDNVVLTDPWKSIFAQASPWSLIFKPTVGIYHGEILLVITTCTAYGNLYIYVLSPKGCGWIDAPSLRKLDDA